MTDVKKNASSALGWFIFALGAIFYSYEFLLRILPSVMTADLMRVHHLTPAHLGYIIALYYVIYTLMQLPVGLLIDRYGPKRLLIFASAICTLGSFLFSNEWSVTITALGRFLIGFGSAFGFIGVLRLASIWLPPHRFALATGLVTTLGMIGGVSGSMGLSYIVQYAGWHSAVLLSAVMGVLLTLIFCFIPEPLCTIESHHSVKTWQVLWQQTHTVIRMPILWINAVIGCLLYVPLSVLGELWGVPYLQTAQGLSLVDAAFAIACLMWGWALGAPLVGWLADKTGQRDYVILAGSSAAVIVILCILNIPFMQHQWLYSLLFLFGVCCAGQILIMVMVRDVCPPALLATGLALTNMIIMAGGMISLPLVGLLLSTDASAGADISPAAYSHIMYIVPLPILLAMGMIAARRRLGKK